MPERQKSLLLEEKTYHYAAASFGSTSEGTTWYQHFQPISVMLWRSSIACHRHSIRSSMTSQLKSLNWPTVNDFRINRFISAVTYLHRLTWYGILSTSHTLL